MSAILYASRPVVISPWAFAASLVATSTVASSALAYFWSRRAAPVAYVGTTGALWLLVSTLPIFREPLTFPPDARHFAATFISIAPFALVPTLALYFPVARRSDLVEIGVLAFFTSVVALPIAFFGGLFAVCSLLGDCL